MPTYQRPPFPYRSFWHPTPPTSSSYPYSYSPNIHLSLAKWLENHVVERMTNGLGDRRKDMMQHFIETKGSGGPITKDDTMIEGVNILGGWVQTLLRSPSFACLGDLVMNPDSVPKLREEIDRAYDKLCLGRGKNISYTEAAKLPYSAAFIKESMRLHPSCSRTGTSTGGDIASPKAYTLASVHVP
jgi:cytochrome P450